MDMFVGYRSLEFLDTKKYNVIPMNNFGNYGVTMVTTWYDGVGDICAI